MVDIFKKTLQTDYWYGDPDLRGIGHTKQRKAFRDKQRRRVRRILKQELKNGLA